MPGFIRLELAGILLLIALAGPVFGQVAAADPSELRQAVADLEALVASTPRESSISLTDGRRITLAREILASDSTNPVALTELGLHHAMNYRWYANFIAVRQPVGGGLRGTATKEFNEACKYLNEAIDSEPSSTPTYRELVRLLIEEDKLEWAADVGERLTTYEPSLADGWLMRGLVARLDGRTEEASRFFERAIQSLPAPEQPQYRDISPLLTAGERRERAAAPASFDKAFWFSRDPLYLTQENERWVDHMARLAYTDIWYGSEMIRGWKTERGALIVRYGIPLADLTFVGALSRYDVLDFGEFDFVFEDLTRGGHYTLYSPRASAGSSWAFDYVIKEGEMAARRPEMFHLDIRETPVETHVAQFRGENGSTDVYIQYALPWQSLSLPGLTANPRSRIGAFITSEQGSVVDSRTRPPSGVQTYRTGLQPFETGSIHFGLKPGTYGTSVEYLSHDRSAFGAARDSLKVVAWPDSGLAISDVLMASAVDVVEGVDSLQQSSTGAAGSTDAIERHGYRISPDPWSSISPDGDALVYFELYGLTLDDRGRSHFDIDARIESHEKHGFISSVFSTITGESSSSAVEVSFSGEADGPDVYRFFAVDLSKQREGTYLLSLRATDSASGESVTVTQGLEIETP